uniref:C-type lectin domain-containing protein n=1 Tax=Chelydra serpentina TaxID=8475 RepID=A0A8C3XTA9_CHESE
MWGAMQEALRRPCCALAANLLSSTNPDAVHLSVSGELAAVKEFHSKMQAQLTVLQRTVGEEHNASPGGEWGQDSWVLFLALPDSLPGPELGYSGFCFLDSVCGHCPWGWAWFQRTCYHFSDSMKTWNEAKQSCLDFGAHLVIINTKEEQAFLVKTRTKSRVYWLGLSDQKVERQWHWVDGSPLKLSFWSTGDYWNKGEPNNLRDGNISEDCAHLLESGRWNDEPCSISYKWICEMATTV